MKAKYPSNIPPDAEEQVTEFYPQGGKRKARYMVNGKAVGIRLFNESGGMDLELSVRDGMPHGPYIRWYASGQALSATTYVKGLEHGTAQQWAADGTLVGEYRMDHGTGLDLWWIEDAEGRWTLAEARYTRRGQRHGFEWWLSEDQASVWREGHYWEDQPHGILREWNAAGRLRRGFPQYWVQGLRVTKRQYQRAAERDATLPKFRDVDNQPRRSFPSEVRSASSGQP